jgi:hypothetical protein
MEDSYTHPVLGQTTRKEADNLIHPTDIQAGCYKHT